ncbi:MAG: beta-lactamase family protein [Opitutaceae bacterium]|nr:beta-lactamase family protein [Opitutaceae bacterium]
MSLERDLQQIIDESLFEIGCPGIIARIETDTFSWNGISGTLDFADIDRGFYICSLSKTYTAIAILKFVEQGKLNLGNRLSDFFDEITPFQDVTIRQLLNHSSHIPDYVLFDDYLSQVNQSPQAPWSREVISKRARKAGFIDASDIASHYSNTGYMYLYQILEKISGKKFSEVIKDLIIDPLELRSTYVATEIDRERVLIPAHDPNFIEFDGDIRGQYHPDWCATGILVSNVREVCSLYRNLLEGAILTSSSMAEMLHGIETPFWMGSSKALSNGKLSNGLGIKICDEFPLGPFWGHGGDCPGYSVWAGYLDVSGGQSITSCILLNTIVGCPPAGLWIKLAERIVS